MNIICEKYKNSKYILMFKSYDIYRVAFFDNKLKMNNYIIQYNIINYFIIQNR